MRVFGYLMIVFFLFSCNSNPCKDRSPELTKELTVLADSITSLISTHHYNPRELKEMGYLEIKNQVYQLVGKSCSKENFMDEFNLLWQSGPFSHVRLNRTEIEAGEMANFIDSLVIGERGAFLDWDSNTAILTVNTMTGIDTKERIKSAYKEIEEKGAEALIIDLRNNNGGTFGGVPLVGHLLNDSIDTGVFVSRKWWEKNNKLPKEEDTKDLDTWSGWSIKSFWTDIQKASLTKISFAPFQPHFNGSVFVLISEKTASAAEFTADAIDQLENVTIIGETTSGQMLSQKIYDLPFEFQIGIPIADYYSFRSGRIEGVGVKPNIEINPAVAMDLAKDLALGKTLETAMESIQDKLDRLNNQPLSGEVLFLMGSMNEWGSNQQQTPQFEYKGDGVYEAELELSSGEYEFKIAPMSWKFDYGANEGDEVIVFDEKKTLVRKSGSPNLAIKIEDKSLLKISLYVTKDLKAKLFVSKESRY